MAFRWLSLKNNFDARRNFIGFTSLSSDRDHRDSYTVVADVSDVPVVPLPTTSRNLLANLST